MIPPGPFCRGMLGKDQGAMYLVTGNYDHPIPAGVHPEIPPMTLVSAHAKGTIRNGALMIA